MRNHFDWIDKDTLFSMIKGHHGSMAFALENFLAGGRSGKVRSFAKFILDTPESDIKEVDLNEDFWAKCKAIELIEYNDVNNRLSSVPSSIRTGRISLSIPAIINFRTSNIYFHKVDANKFWFGDSNKDLKIEERLINRDQTAVINENYLARKVGGRPPKYAWDKIVIEAATYIYENGLNISDDKIYNYLIEKFSDPDGGPSRSSMQEHVGPLIRRLRHVEGR